MKKRKSSLIILKDILSGLFSDGILPFDPADAALWKHWQAVVGEAAAAHAKPLWIKDGVLKVGVTEPIWLNELRFASEDIRAALNGALGRQSVRIIEFRAAPPEKSRPFR